jgi:hypothetical protein
MCERAWGEQKEETTMSREFTKRLLGVMLVLAMAIPAMAGPRVSKSERATVKSTLTLPSAITIAGKNLKPGVYSVVADESKVKISLDGRVVAEAPIQWADATGKIQQTAVVLDSNNQLKEIRFSGKSRYVVLQ